MQKRMKSWTKKTTTIKMMTTEINNYFCSQKFTALSVDFERRNLRSCNCAVAEPIDLPWLSLNPGQLFNTPDLQAERQQMLENQPAASCEDMCWSPERQNLPSRRTMMQTQTPRPLLIQAQPTTLVITLGSTCNLTCVYCCKEFSTAWYRDIQEHGDYSLGDRFQITVKDKIVNRLSQGEHVASYGYDLLMQEIAKFDSVETVDFAGGEPFLYNHVPDIVNKLSKSTHIRLFTGLGVNSTRLQHQLDKINNWSNITVFVSAETLGDRYEFVRYSNSFDKFLTNLKILQAHGCQVVFRSVVSNTTIFDIVAFKKYFEDYEITYQFCAEPDFLAVNVLDQQTKNELIENLNASDISIKDQIIQALEQPCTDQQKSQFGQYLQEFAARRKLSLNIFPDSMIQWLALEEHHVV